MIFPAVFYYLKTIIIKTKQQYTTNFNVTYFFIKLLYAS